MNLKPYDRIEFLLNPDITFFNYGSFGATPRYILSLLQEMQLRVERDPVQFFKSHHYNYIDASRESLAVFLHTQPQNLYFTPNPSHAVNVIAKNLALKAGDEVLGNDLEYGGCDRTWEYYCQKAGAIYKRPQITVPLDEDVFVEELFAAVTENTRLIFISHITSSTALILPVEKVIQKARAIGIPVFVDGAHAPGHIPLNIDALDADYYTGACHKWMMTPKGVSFLYVKENKVLEPLLISWGYNSPILYHNTITDPQEMQGTRDLAAWCILPDIITYLKEIGYHEKLWKARELMVSQVEKFSSFMGTPFTTHHCNMVAFPIQTQNPIELQNKLYQDHKIEIPIVPFREIVLMRISAHLFIEEKDYNYLAEVIQKLSDT
jgi:isopenicillin-N epimerase